MSGTSNRILLAYYLLKQSTFGKNYVLNPSCFVNTANITLSGASISRNTSSSLTSVSDLQVGYTAAAQYAEWVMETLDNSMAGRNCELTADYKLSLGAGATVIAEVYQNSVSIASTTLLASSSSQPLSIVVPCNSSSTTFRVTQSVGAVTSTLNIANISYGRATNTSTQSAIGNWQGLDSTIALTFNNLGTVTSTGLRYRRNGDSVELQGYVDLGTVTGSTASITLSGSSIDTNKLSFANNNIIGYANAVATASQNVYGAGSASVLFLDGSTSNTIFFAANTASSAYTKGTGTGLFINNARVNIYLRFPIQGWSAESAFRVEQANQFANLRWTGNTGCNWSTTSSTWVDLPQNTSCNTPIALGKGLEAATTKTPRIQVSSLPAGNYMVIAQGVFLPDNAGTACRYRISDGTNFRGYTQLSTSSAADDRTGTVIGVFNYTSTQGALTFAMQSQRDAGSANCLIGNADSTTEFSMSIIPMNTVINTPILLGSVTSNSSTTAERIERAQVTVSNTAAAIVSQSGSWLGVTNGASAGLTTGTYSGFSSAPSCTCTVIGAATTSATHCIFTAEPTTSTILISRNRAGAAENGDVNIICMGPR